MVWSVPLDPPFDAANVPLQIGPMAIEATRGSKNICLSSQNLLGLDDSSAGLADLVERGGRVARPQVHAAAGVRDHRDGKAESAGVERGEFHAVIGRQPGDENVRDAPLTQVIAEPGGASMTVVEEATVAVDFRIDALLKNPFHPRGVEPGREFGPAAMLYAMHGPEHLRQPGQLAKIAEILSGIHRGEAAVPGRMPVLGGDYQREGRLEPIGEGNDPIPFRHGQSAAGKEIVLNIDKNEGVHGRNTDEPKKS